MEIELGDGVKMKDFVGLRNRKKKIIIGFLFYLVLAIFLKLTLLDFVPLYILLAPLAIGALVFLFFSMAYVLIMWFSKDF